jgi:hypothetical protein
MVQQETTIIFHMLKYAVFAIGKTICINQQVNIYDGFIFRNILDATDKFQDDARLDTGCLDVACY